MSVLEDFSTVQTHFSPDPPCPWIATQVLLFHARFICPGLPILHHGRVLRWKPRPRDNFGHLPKARFYVQRMRVSRGRSQRSRQTNHRNCDCLSHFRPPQRFKSKLTIPRYSEKSTPSPTLHCLRCRTTSEQPMEPGMVLSTDVQSSRIRNWDERHLPMARRRKSEPW